MKHINALLFLVVVSFFGCAEEVETHKSIEGFVRINGAQHYYTFSGSADTLIVLHGGPGLSHRYLKPQLDSLLSENFTLLYYDQRGSGWTEGEKDTTQLTITAFVHDLEHFRKHFGLEQVNLLGHSFGGLLAMHYAISYPEHMKSMILVDSDAASYAYRTPYQIKMIEERLSETQNAYLDSIENTANFKGYDPLTYEHYYKTFLTSYFANPRDTAHLKLGFDSINVPKISHTNSIVRASLGEYDIHDQLSRINCKTLIMQGTESVFSVEGAMAIHENIKDSQLQLFENCGHFEYIEAPKKFKQLVVDFYSNDRTN